MSVATSSADALIGTEVLGTYRLVEVLGQGGMSVVYRGRHMLTEQDVAVKVLPPELAGHAEVKARFVEEARTLARLEHPNIVLLHNFVEESGHLYLVMQFAEGDSFEEIIEREGRVLPADVAAVGIEVCRALEYAHERGVVHRDIKPSNIIIRGDSSVKVMDFGIAKIVGSSKLTQTGQTMGTVRYMSPEQVRGKQVDHRSDLYSLGVTLYEALCGRTPFDGDTHYDIMRKHLTDLPLPPSKVVDIPAAFDETLLRSLEKNQERRFQSARQFRRALQALPVDAKGRRITRSVPMRALDSAEVASAPAPRPRRRRRRASAPMWIALSLLLLSGAAVLWALLDMTDPQQQPARPSRASPVVLPPKKLNWPAPHAVALGLHCAVDQRFPDLRLRVMSVDDRDVLPVARIYRRARGAYRQYLRAQGIDVAFEIGPLNLVLVGQQLLNNRAHWPTAKPNVDYPTRYQASSATLYVQNGERMMDSDLPYGLALHFSARIPDRALTDERRYELAEGFERHLARPR
jgi:serine/threonine protein kinase